MREGLSASWPANRQCECRCLNKVINAEGAISRIVSTPAIDVSRTDVNVSRPFSAQLPRRLAKQESAEPLFKVQTLGRELLIRQAQGSRGLDFVDSRASPTGPVTECSANPAPSPFRLLLIDAGCPERHY